MHFDGVNLEEEFFSFSYCLFHNRLNQKLTVSVCDWYQYAISCLGLELYKFFS